MAVRQTRNQSGGPKLTQNARAGFLGIAPAPLLAIGVLALLGLVAGGFLLHSRLDKLETELAFAKRDVESTNERLMSLQREVSQIRQDQSSAAAMIARLDNRLSAMAQPTSPQNNELQITPVEAKLIREFLMKIDAFKPMVEAGYKVGDSIPEDQLLDFSAVLTQGMPKLKNTNYTIDQTGSIIIVSENRIVAILDFVNVAR
jgi:septal ring factor EnvC (AmiA/AmiB activator)